MTASAIEAEIASIYLNAQLIVEWRQTLTDMGHPQPPTLICTNNKTACSILDDTMEQKHSKAIDMCFLWLKDRVNNHKQFKLKWVSGTENLADYFLKHHMGSHHCRICPIYLYSQGKSSTTLKGCVKISNSNSQERVDSLD